MLIMVVVAMVALLAFSAFVIDYGVMWTGRGQVADGGRRRSARGRGRARLRQPDRFRHAAKTKARATAREQRVGAAAGRAVDGRHVPGVPAAGRRRYLREGRRVPQPDAGQRPADVLRALVGVTAQGVRSTATAQVGIGNAAKCVKPWAVADKWAEHWEDKMASTAPGHRISLRQVHEQGRVDPTLTPDVYIPPTANSAGTASRHLTQTATRHSDYGLEITLKIGDSKDRLSSGWFQALEMPNPNCNGGGGALYECNIGKCNPNVYTIGETVNVSSEQGNMVGPTKKGVQDIADLDPNASWDQATKSIRGAVLQGPAPARAGKYYNISPRIVPVPLMNIDAFFAGTPNGKSSVPITNIMGFFVECLGGKKNNCSDGKEVVGRLVASRNDEGNDWRRRQPLSLKPSGWFVE